MLLDGTQIAVPPPSEAPMGPPLHEPWSKPDMEYVRQQTAPIRCVLNVSDIPGTSSQPLYPGQPKELLSTRDITMVSNSCEPCAHQRLHHTNRRGIVPEDIVASHQHPCRHTTLAARVLEHCHTVSR